MAKTLSRIKTIDITIIENSQEKVEKITVQKAGLGKWKKLTDSIKKLFELLPEILKEKGVKDTDKFIEQMEIQDLLLLIPDMLTVATDEVINILALSTDLDAEYIEKNVGLDEAVELFEVIIEVNNIVKVVEKGKNLINLLGMGMRAQKTLTKRNSSTN